MATQDSIMGLFASPEMYQQQRDQAALASFAKQAELDPLQRAAMGTMYGGYQLGNALAGAMGAEDPQLKMQSARQQILKGVNPQDMKSIEAAAVQFSRMGDGQGVQAMQDLAAKQAKIIKDLREGNAAMLTTEQRNFKQAVDDGYKGTFNQWLTEQKRAGATNVSLSATADKSYGSELGGLVAKSDMAARDAAIAAPETLAGIERTRSLLDSGKVFTGTGANVKLNVLAFGQALGVTGANDNEVITNTQQLQQQRAKAVLSQVKASGLGSGQGFTDKDLAFLEKAAAGTITLSADTLREQLRIEEKAARAATNKWNARVKTLPPQLTTSMGLSEVTIPTSPFKPAGQIPTTGGKTGNPLVDKYLTSPQEGK